MHPALEQLLDDLVQVVETQEHRINEVRLKFPIPPSNYLSEMETKQAYDEFAKIICAFGRANEDWTYKESNWISPALGFKAQYDKFIEDERQSTVSIGERIDITLNKPNTLGLQNFESIRFEAGALINRYYNQDMWHAFNLAYKNVEGGLPAILNFILEKRLERTINFESVWAINQVLGSRERPSENTAPLFDWRLQIEQVRAYKDRYAAYLPTDYLEENDEYSATTFRTVLLQHYAITRRMQKLIL